MSSPWGVWAAALVALPIITGVTGVVTSLLFVMVSSHFVNLSSDAITMGALIGLGVGIDYALFIVDRYRKEIVTGRHRAAGRRRPAAAS